MDEEPFDITEFMRQLQSFRQVLDQVRATNERLLSAATRQCSCSVWEDEMLSGSFTEVKEQIELIGNRMDKRDAEINTLQESVSHITSKLNDTLQLIQQKSKTGKVRLKNTREKRRATGTGQATSETNILETDALGVSPNDTDLTDVNIPGYSQDSLVSGNDHLKLTNFAPNTLRSKEQVQNTSKSAKLEGKTLKETSLKEKITGNGHTNTRSNKLVTNQVKRSNIQSTSPGNDYKSNIPVTNQGNKSLQKMPDNVDRRKQTSKITHVHHEDTFTSEQRNQSKQLPELEKDNFGFKRRSTQGADDNRRIYFTENQNSQSEDAQGYQAEAENVLKYGKEMANISAAFQGMLEMDSDHSLAEIGFREWFSYAEDEKRKGSQRKLSRGRGPDTVICLDTSGSMVGEPFMQMISIAVQIVEGIKQVNFVLPIPENVSVTTFGAESKVAIHLTDKYDDVIDTIKHIPHPKGPSPMAGGLLVALAGCLGNGAGVTINHLVVGTRIILISDGRATPDHIRIDHDNVQMNTAANFRVDFNLNDVARNLKRRHVRVYCIPVGEANMTTLKKVSDITYGKMCSAMDIPRVIRYAQNLLQATEIVVNAHVDEDVDPRMVYNVAFDNAPSLNLRPEEKEDVVDLAVSLQKSAVPEEEQTKERYSDLPPLGTRVCRGPGWHYGLQDTNGPGTVYNHGKNGMVWVEWDNGHKNCYNYRLGMEIVEVDNPRILGNNELIAVGCHVKKGPDFRENRKIGDIKPNDVGVVVKIREDGVVYVRWPNKKIGLHGYGADGRFELTICGENEVHTPKSRPDRRVQQRRRDASPDDELRIESFLSPPS